jgi:hypothetical protein
MAGRDSEPVSTPRTAADIVLLLHRHFRTYNFDRIRALYHPDGRFITLAGGPAPLGREETIAAFERARRDVIYSAQAEEEPIEIDPVAALAVGSIRYRTPGGGHALVSRVWVFTAKDGLLYRTVPVADEAAGRALYETSGIELDI